MLYQFKQQLKDFIVEEILPELPNGEGEVFYVFFEKENLTTMEVVAFLGQELSLSREEIGIAGLKDKVGITRQWITLYKSVVDRIGESAFVSVLSTKVKIKKTTWGNTFLKV